MLSKSRTRDDGILEKKTDDLSGAREGGRYDNLLSRPGIPARLRTGPTEYDGQILEPGDLAFNYRRPATVAEAVRYGPRFQG